MPFSVSQPYSRMKKAEPPLYNQTLVNKGTGQLVILLHGLFGNYALWRSTVEALQDNYHVVVPRLPIFDLPAHHTNVKYLVKVLHEFIEWNEFRSVVLVGHAIGGQVALMYTSLYPENVSKLVLAGSAGLHEGPLTEESLADSVVDYGFVQRMVSQAFYEETPMLEYFVDEIYLTVRNIPKRLMIGSMIKSSNLNDVTHFLNKIETQTLLLWGLEDQISPPETALHFYDYLRNAELRFIKECGHVPMIEQPKVFNKHLLSFIQPL